MYCAQAAKTRTDTALVVLVDGLTGDDGAGGATPWLRVRDPAGNEGFVPGRYTAALP